MQNFFKNKLIYIAIPLVLTALLVGGTIFLQSILEPKPVPADLSAISSEKVITFSGRGWGHGVGLCQYGAEGSARAGKNHAEILDFYYPGTRIENLNKTDKTVLRVEIAKGLDAGNISATGDFEIANRRGQQIATDKAGHVWTLLPDGAGKIILKDPNGQNKGKFSSIIFKPYPLKSNSILRVVNNNHRYRGFISVNLMGSNSLRIINHVVLEDYIKGIDEVPVGWNIETLKAQAIAARSYAVSRLNSKEKYGFDLYSDQRDQVYIGFEEEVSDNAKRWTDASTQTAGKVLTYDGKIISGAYYHSTCGGSTENVEDVWETHEPLEYLRARTCDSCDFSPKYKWETRFKVSELQEILNSNPQTKIDGRLVKAEVFSRKGGRRVEYVSLYGTGGRRDVKGADIRYVLGLDSTWFDVINPKNSK